jgi:hypothetical protein|tara:strand:+ start:218 stop:589 length:372 start_codon:yes stop_codon:yes gene_type:complete
MVTETKLDDLKAKAADFINKNISSLMGENAARISEEDRKVVNSILKIGSKIPTVGSLIGADKTVGSILKAIEKNKNKEILERAEAGKGMKAGGLVKGKKKSVKPKKKSVAGRLAKRGYGIART